jgi:hypothetical protein
MEVSETRGRTSERSMQQTKLTRGDVHEMIEALVGTTRTNNLPGRRDPIVWTHPRLNGLFKIQWVPGDFA